MKSNWFLSTGGIQNGQLLDGEKESVRVCVEASFRGNSAGLTGGEMSHRLPKQEN